jgi:haloacetate dehalogenase
MLSLPPSGYTCEDYRASASIDLDHDRKDRSEGRKISAPAVRILWGSNGMIPKFGDPVEIWKEVSGDNVQVTGRSIDSGHFIPEEKSKEVLKEIIDFFN